MDEHVCAWGQVGEDPCPFLSQFKCLHVVADPLSWGVHYQYQSPSGSVGNYKLSSGWDVGTTLDEVILCEICSHIMTSSRERSFQGYPIFAFTVDEGKGLLHASRNIKEGKHQFGRT